MPQEVGDLTELVVAARAGDQQAFEALVRATYADTYTLAYRLTGDEEDARDVVQESYLRAYRGLKRFRGDAQFTTWLYRITANCASTHLGRRAKHRHDELADDAPVADTDPDVDPAARTDARATRDRLDRARCGACRPVCGRWWCCATSTTCPTRPSPPSWASPSRPPRSGCTGRGKKLRENLFPPRGGQGREEGDARAV